MMAHSDREFSNSHFPAIVEKYRGQESFENCKGSNFAKILTAVASGIACIKCNCCAYFWLQPVHTVKSFLGNLPLLLLGNETPNHSSASFHSTFQLSTSNCVERCRRLLIRCTSSPIRSHSGETETGSCQRDKAVEMLRMQSSS